MVFESLVQTIVRSGLPQANLIASLIVILIFIGIAKVVNVILKKILTLTVKTTLDLDEKIIHAITLPIYITLFLVGFRIALFRLDFLQAYVSQLAIGFNLAWLTLGGFVAVRVVGVVLEYFGVLLAKKSGTHATTIMGPVTRVVKGLIIFFVALAFLGAFGIDITPFIFGWGLLGFAVVLALQPVLMDIFSGFSIITTRTFKVGDRIILPTGEICELQDIKMQNALLYDLINDNYYSVSNTDLTKQKITILSNGKLKIMIPFKVDYNNIEKASEIALNIAKTSSYLSNPAKPTVHILELGGTAKLELAFWINDCSKKHDVIDEVNAKLIKEFSKAKIQLK